VVDVPALATGQWVHVAVTLSGKVATLYVNGVPVGRNVGCFLQPFQMGDTPQNWIGRSQFTADPYLSGKIDDFRVYNYALTGNAVYALWGQSSNHAPAFSAERIARVNAAEDSSYGSTAQTVSTDASDADGGAMTFTKLDGPSWLSVAANGSLSGTPTNDDVGQNTFVIQVADSSGGASITRLNLSVLNTNDAPMWSAATLVRSAVSPSVAYSGTIADSASDVDVGDTISFSKTSGPSWLSIAADGTLSGTPAVGDAGTNSFVVRVTDAAGAYSEATLQIPVAAYTLQARYALDGNGDESLGGTAATLNGTVSYADGVLNQALVLDGTTTYGTLGTLPNLVYKDMSVSAWVWWDGGSAWQRIFDFGSGTDEYVFLSTSNGSGMRFSIKENGVEQVLDAGALPTGQWVHVAVTLGGNTATIYLNGVAKATSSSITNDPSNISLTQCFIGDSQYAADPLFAGKIDDLRLYNYALTPTEISSMVTTAPAITPSGFIGVSAGSKVVLSWNASANAQSYIIKRATTPGGPYTTIASGISSATYTDTTVQSGSTYYYVITSVNAQGTGTPSAEISVVVSDLLLLLKLDDGTGTTAADSSGNGYDGTLVNGPTWTGGYFNRGLNFPATASQHVTLPAGLVNQLTDYTISSWVKVPAFVTNTRIFDFSTSTTPGATVGSYMFLTPQYTTTGGNGAKMRFAITTAGYSAEKAIISSTALTAGTWAHVAITRSGNTGTMYLNGVQVGQNTSMTIGPANLGSISRNYLGRSAYSGDPYLNGSIDDFRIYSRALTAAEILAMGAPPAGAPSSLAAVADMGQVTLTWLPNATTTYTVKRATTSGGPYDTIASGLTDTTYVDTSVTNETTYYYVVSGSNAAGSGPDSAEVAAKPTTLRLLLKFDETGGAVAADSSGRAKDATLVNAPSFTTGKVNNAIQLTQASSQYVTMPSGIVSDLTTATIMGWVKTSSVSTWQRVFDFGTGTTNYMFLAPQYATGSAANKPRFAIRTSSVTEQQIDSSVTMPVGSWNHIAVVLNGSVGTLYLNGVAVGQNTAMTLNPSSLGATTLNYLGKSQFSDPYLNGSLDEFRIYGRALSASEISLFASPLAAPQSVVATPGPLSMDLSWASVANATRYSVYYATTSGGPYVLLSGSQTALTRQHAGLTYGTSYYYVISAANDIYQSPLSAEIMASPGSALIAASETAAPGLSLVQGSSGNPGSVHLSTAGSALGHSYQLQQSVDLTTWTDVGEPVDGTGQALDLSTSRDSLLPRCFYRIVITR
jgi:Concanavalin A-like lectin/glucanases superfamily/Putative Ig domain